MIRDRKMYVAPTPFGLASGVAHAQTLILPEGFDVLEGFVNVGRLVRTEAETLIVGYAFDLRTNCLVPSTAPNPSAGRTHVFNAWRLNCAPGEAVELRKLGTPDACEGDSCE